MPHFFSSSVVPSPRPLAVLRYIFTQDPLAPKHEGNLIDRHLIQIHGVASRHPVGVLWHGVYRSTGGSYGAGGLVGSVVGDGGSSGWRVGSGLPSESRSGFGVGWGGLVGSEWEWAFRPQTHRSRVCPTVRFGSSPRGDSAVPRAHTRPPALATAKRTGMATRLPLVIVGIFRLLDSWVPPVVHPASAGAKGFRCFIRLDSSRWSSRLGNRRKPNTRQRWSQCHGESFSLTENVKGLRNRLSFTKYLCNSCGN